MKVTQVQRQKDGTEISFKITSKEARYLAHWLGCSDDCDYPELRIKGRKLAHKLYKDGVYRAW